MPLAASPGEASRPAALAQKMSARGSRAPKNEQIHFLGQSRADPNLSPTRADLAPLA